MYHYTLEKSCLKKLELVNLKRFQLVKLKKLYTKPSPEYYNIKIIYGGDGN